MEQIKITFLGDIMCQGPFLTAYGTESGYDFSPVFQEMKKTFSQADLVVGNLETPVTDNSDLTKERYCFCSPKEFAEAAYDAGITCVSTANNHCMDRGRKGISATIRCLDEIGFAHTGVFDRGGRDEKRNPLILSVGGMTIGVMSYTYGTNAFSNHQYLKKEDRYCVNLFQNQELPDPVSRFFFRRRKKIPGVFKKLYRLASPAQAALPVFEKRYPSRAREMYLLEDIRAMKEKKPDLIIFCMHSGGQYNEEPNEYTRYLAGLLADQGIPIIIGNHEHVVHGCDLSGIRENRFTAWCLGNFSGLAGVTREPFDKMSEYSVACSLYIGKQDKRIRKVGCRVLKSVPYKDTQGACTVPVYELIQAEAEPEKKRQLMRDMAAVASRFCGRQISETEICEEYVVWEAGSSPLNMNEEKRNPHEHRIN